MPASVAVRLLLLWTLVLQVFAQPDDGQYIEVEFDPMDGPDDDAGEVLEEAIAANPNMRGGPAPGPNGPVVLVGGPGPAALGPAARGDAQRREDELDRAIAGMLGNIIAAAGGQMPTDRPKGGAAPKASGPGAASPAGGANPGPKMGIGDIRSLFPGPLIIEEDGGPSDDPFGAPDPMVMDMMQGIGRAFREDMVPAIHQAGGRGGAPSSCNADLQKHCASAKSPLHCLGRHTADISDACRKDVGKSVPFVCSQAIDRFCDILQSGILSCLGSHLQDLDGTCQDAVAATQKVIAKVNTQKTSLVNLKTGAKKVHVPPLAAAAASISGAGSQTRAPAAAPASLSERERDLDQQLARRVEAEAASVYNSRPFAPPSGQAEHYNFLTVLMTPVALACVVYVFAYTDFVKEAFEHLKPFLDDGRQPLRGGVGAKPLAL